MDKCRLDSEMGQKWCFRCLLLNRILCFIFQSEGFLFSVKENCPIIEDENSLLLLSMITLFSKLMVRTQSFFLFINTMKDRYCYMRILGHEMQGG